MRVYTLAGYRHQALHQYQKVKEILQRELEVEPSPETTELYLAVVENRLRSNRNAGFIRIPLTIPAREPATASLIGRNREMQRLKELIAQSKLDADASHSSAASRGARAGWRRRRGLRQRTGNACDLWGRIRTGWASPYGPFVERSERFNGMPKQSIHEKLGILVNHLGRLLPELASPELARLLPESVPPDRKRPVLELDMGQERQRLFDAVVAVFIALAQDSPLVVFLDDLHAADESSLQLLHYIARRLSDVPIFFICSIREEEVVWGTPMARLFSELLRNRLTQRINLLRLNSDDMASLASGLLGGGRQRPAWWTPVSTNRR